MIDDLKQRRQDALNKIRSLGFSVYPDEGAHYYVHLHIKDDYSRSYLAIREVNHDQLRAITVPIDEDVKANHIDRLSNLPWVSKSEYRETHIK